VSNLQKLSRLSLIEWLLLVGAVLMLPMVSLSLKQKGFRKTEKFLARFSRTEIEADSTFRVGQAARMVSVAANNGFFLAQCLDQAVTLWWMLGLMGIRSTIRFGVYKTEKGIEAHAWVLYQDVVVLGQLEELAEYTPLLDVNVERQ
jgi:hypothetical protein